VKGMARFYSTAAGQESGIADSGTERLRAFGGACDAKVSDVFRTEV